MPQWQRKFAEGYIRSGRTFQRPLVGDLVPIGEIDSPDPTGIPAAAEWRRWYGDDDEYDFEDDEDGIGPMTLTTRRQPRLMPLLSSQYGGKAPTGLGYFGGSVQTDPTGLYWRPYTNPAGSALASGGASGPAFQHTAHNFAQQGSAPLGWGAVGALSLGPRARGAAMSQSIQGSSMQERHAALRAQVGHLEDKMSPADDAIIEITWMLEQNDILHSATRKLGGTWTLTIPNDGNAVDVQDDVLTALKALQDAYAPDGLRINRTECTDAGCSYQLVPPGGAAAGGGAGQTGVTMGLGALVGGAVGGPIGALIGGVGGLLFDGFRKG